MTSSPQSNTPASLPPASHSANSSLSTTLLPREEESFDYQAVLSVVNRRAWLILITILAVTGGIWFRTFNQPPRYRSSFQMLVEPIAGDEEFKEELGQLSDRISSSRQGGLDYPTQIQVLTSSQLMRPIYQDLRSDYPNLSYQNLIGNLRVFRLGETKIIAVSYESSNPELAGSVTKTVAEAYIDYSEQQQQAGEQRVLALIEEQLPTLRNQVQSIEDEIQEVRETNNVINPTTKGNQLSGNLGTLEQRQRETRIAIEENISLRENLLQQLGLSLDEAMTTVALSEAPRYQELLNQLKEIETKIAVELGRFKEDSPNIQVLKEQKESILNLLEEESLAVLGKRVVSDEIRSQVSSPNPIRLSLTQNLIDATNQIQTLRVRLDALETAEAEIRDDLNNLADLARQYEGMNQRLQIAQDNLKRFINRREQLKIQSAQSALPWQLLEEPFQPTEPISGNLRGLLLGVVAGLLAGAGVAYLAEKIDNKFHTPHDLKEVSPLSLLAVIPFLRTLQDSQMNGNTGVIPLELELETLGLNGKALTSGDSEKNDKERATEDSFFAFRESFQALYANLSFMTPDDHPAKSLVISSSIPGEGKSTIALNLARVAASVGKKVLLVDADMRRPQLHQVLELSNQSGLSNVISMGLRVKEAIQLSPINSNLSVLTSGPTPPDPNRLLSSEKMTQLMEEWQNLFDLVIYDSPPLAGIADAKLLASRANTSLIMVVGLGILDRSLFKDVMDTLQASKITVLGLVANGRKSGSMGEYYYYYYDNYYSYGRSRASQSSLVPSNGLSNSSSNEEE